ncbi:MAG: DNA polymerase I [Burkholderiales bacterium]|nr:DNA polymerase I [Burkholderiales bacterium]
MKTLVLVDASSYLYRAFHALPDLRNKAGEPTGAIYGVLNMLRRLHKDVAADYSACIFDAKGRTFRDDLYDRYKANRPPMPDDLGAQVAPLHECIRALGWPLLEVPGVEADDVIGTLASRACQAGMRVVISSGDKDLTQLVNGSVTMVNTMSNETYDEAGVQAKFGVRPDQIVDYLTLIGDSVDNVPGVDKVGPKTAVRLLQQYGSLDSLMLHAGEVGGVVGENLRRALPWLPTARALLTVKCDVVLPAGFDQMAHVEPDRDKLAALYTRLEFRTWLRELIGAGSPPAVVAPAQEEAARPARARAYETVLTPVQFSAWIERLQSAELVCVDTETTGLDPHNARLVGVSLSVEPERACYIPLAHAYAGAPAQLAFESTLERLRPWLEDATRFKVGQNAKYDTHIFANHGVRMRGVVHDTCVQSYVLESHRSHDMDSLAQRHLGLETITFEEVAGKGAAQIGFDQVDIERATGYSAEDADVTLQLHRALYPRIVADERLHFVYERIEIPVMEVLYEMERTGVLIDSTRLARHSHELGRRLLEIEQQAKDVAGQPFNLNSPKQIQEILFERHGLPVIKKTPGGQPSTDEDVLEQLALDYPLARLILDYRALSKLKSTYTDKLPRMVNARTGRVHTTYNQTTAVTGRLSSNDPNLQNIPIRNAEGRRIREAFIAAPGHQLVSADYSQVELRIMAHLSRDATLLEAFRSGEDVHRRTAAEILGLAPDAVTSEQRRYAKTINFGLIYGMSAFGLASQLGIERSAAQQYMDRYFTRYPGVKQYMDAARQSARETGYVETVFGRRLYLPDINASSSQRRMGAERAAINAPMQGTAADLIKLAMLAVHRWLASQRMATRLILQVHDELVLEVPDEEVGSVRAHLPGLMCGVATLDVPLVVDIGAGPNWDKAH